MLARAFSLIFAIVLSLAPLALAGEEDEAFKVKIATLICKLFNLDQDSLVIESLLKSEAIEGAKEVVVRIGNNRATVYVIGDKMIMGRVYDLNFDPYQGNMKKISVKARPSRGSGSVLLVEYSDFQ